MSTEFSMKNTLLELLEGSGPGIRLFFQKEMLGLIPEKYHTIPMEEWADSFMLPWGLPLPLRDLVEDANMLVNEKEYWEMVPLWDKQHFTIDSNDIHSVSLMIPKSYLKGIRPAVLIVPGGSYESVSFHNEGLMTAACLDKAGYRTFIMNYRVSPNRYPDPQLDLALAIKHLRVYAKQYQIDPDDLMILGYSAGGHLCASTTALWEEIQERLQEELEKRLPDIADVYKDIPIRPNKVCLGYPVISFLKECHEPSFQALTGGDESLREHLSIEKQVSSDYPKTFLWACEDDLLVPAGNARRMARVLETNHVPCEFVLYPEGGHGCGIGTGTSAEGWINTMLQFMKE